MEKLANIARLAQKREIASRVRHVRWVKDFILHFVSNFCICDRGLGYYIYDKSETL